MIPPIESMKNAFSIEGKNVIVTGGNGGIGLGIAKAMAESGANVAILCRDMKKAEGALLELNAIGGKHQAFSCDILDPISVRDAVAAVCAAYGGVDILVNNSGVACNSKFLDMDQNISEWRRVIDTDLTGMAQMTYEVGKRMRDAGKGGAIVNITSNSGTIVNKGLGLSPYAAAKAGADHFTRCMAVELGEYNIRVNAIAPGFIHAGFGANPSPMLIKLVEDQQPLKRMGEAIEVGALAIFLASPASAHITGTVTLIDGGYRLSC